MTINIKESNLNEQLEYVYKFFKPEVESKQMRLSINNKFNSEETIIQTDSEKIYAILINLVKNAIKYSSEGSIELGFTLKPVIDPVEVEFFVKDTGVGIAQDNHKAIFDRFYQTDNLSKIAQQGAGLGLSITKAYVEMLGGRIWVESEVGKGSVFYFTLPMNSEIQRNVVNENIVPTDSLDYQTKKLKVLIAEDDEASLRLASLAVKKLSKETFEVSTGLDAIEMYLKNQDIDLILMDVQMPGLNGYEATRKIRQYNKDVVIIAQTAYGFSGDREMAIQAGCNDYIAKPLNKRELITLIKKYIN